MNIFERLNEDIKEKCSGCGGCSQICKNKCIDMITAYNGFLYPKKNDNICSECGKCIGACPVLRAYDPFYERKAYYAAVNKDPKKLLQSSSGGGISCRRRLCFKTRGRGIWSRFR